MLEEFYNYLAKKVIEYFNAVGVKNGEKFDIQFEKEEEVKSLYEQIKNVTSIEEFTYTAKLGEEEYKSYSFNSGDIKVIVAATINGVQSDYLTRLRNVVGNEDYEIFKNSAIIFIHDSSLDSIISGAISFKREGMPFHTSEIIKDVEKDLKKSSLKDYEKSIIQFELEKSYSTNTEGGTLLQFKELLDVVNKGTIEGEDYKNFGLFFDNQLSNFDNKQRSERIELNADIYRRIDKIHKYQGDISNALDKFLDSNGVEVLSKPTEWENVGFEKVIQSYNNKLNTKKIRYEGFTLGNIKEEHFWEKPKSTTKAGERIRQIIIFNPERLTTLNLSFNFDERISQKDIIYDNGQEAGAKATGKRISVEIDHSIGNVSFNTIKLKSTENYEFKIVVLDTDNSIFNQPEIETGYSIGKVKKKDSIFIDTANSTLILNKHVDTIERHVITEQNQEIIIEDARSRIEIINEVVLNEDENAVNVNIVIDEITIPFSIKDEGQKAVKISGYHVWTKKREEKKDFKYIDDRLIQGNVPYFATDDFRKNLKREEEIIKLEGVAFIENSNGLIQEDLDLPEDLINAYAALINYYKANGLLPSLAHYEDEVYELSLIYVKEFLKALDTINDGDYPCKRHNDLVRVGTIIIEDMEDKILFTPLHPLNVIYQLSIEDNVGNEKLNENLLKKLNSLYLLPYISERKKLYKPLEQSNSLEWKSYVPNNEKKYKSSRKFISKLVKEKLEEFVGHFSYLFSLSAKASIKINLINTGDSKEVLQGIINYYIGQLKNKVEVKDLKDIEINIYSDEESNIFEELSYYETASEIEDNLEISLDASNISKNYSKEDILYLCRDKLKFYKKNVNNESYEYCHITFYEMEQSMETIDSKMDDMTTGISLNGLLSGVPSKYINNSYKTGFGRKFMDDSKDNILLRIATKLNALYKANHRELTFNGLESLTTIISDKDKKKLDKIYDSSNWVTFIEPKFDLDFFKSNNKDKDLLIIHYNDQFTSSSGYDAITVTRKSEQYAKIIKEFLNTKKIGVNDEQVVHVINCFNAINGDWLLRLISGKGQFSREKISLISAVKLSLAYFYHKDIIWVPISLEEILRVSGGAGLNSSQGLFSVKNLKGNGVYCDDILLVGIENDEKNIKVHYYPVEVKVGKNVAKESNKGKKQAYKTRNYLEKHMIDLEDEDETRKFAKKMYRNFMMQLVLVSAEKLQLYGIWNEQNWNLITNGEIRKKLLNDEYTIANDLDNIIGRGAFLSFKENLVFNNVQKIDISKAELGDEYDEIEYEKGNKLLEILFTENLGYQYIIGNIEEIKSELLNGTTDISNEILLANKYNKVNNSKEESKNDILNQDNKEINSYDKSENEDKTLYANKLFSNQKSNDYSVVIGKEISGDETIIYDPKRSGNPLSNMNVMITGSSGKGKTQLLKSMIVQQRKRGTNLLVFDFKNDFSDKEFLEMAKMKCINLEFKGLPYNPLIPPVKEDDGVKMMNIGEHILALSGVFKQVYKLGAQQEASLKNAFRKIYKENGINPRLNEVKESDKLYYPIIDDIADILEEDDDKAYSRLDTLFNYGLFRSDTRDVSLVELLNDSYVFNLSSISNDEVKNAIAKIIVVSTHQYMNTLPHAPNDIKNIFVFDEAHRFLGEPSLEKLARECRAYGMAIWLSSQYPSDYPDEIRGCLETKIIHGNGDDEEKIKAIKKLVNYDGDDRDISKLGLFQAIFSNTHYNKKFINTIGFPHMLLMNELNEKRYLNINEIKSIENVRKEEVIKYLLNLNLINLEEDTITESKQIFL